MDFVFLAADRPLDPQQLTAEFEKRCFCQSAFSHIETDLPGGFRFMARHRPLLQGPPLYLPPKGSAAAASGLTFMFMSGYLVDPTAERRKPIAQHLAERFASGSLESVFDLIGEFVMVYGEGERLICRTARTASLSAYYSQCAAGAAIASRTSLCQLLSTPAERRPDLLGQLQLLSHDSFLDDRTFYSNTRRIPPFHAIEMRAKPARIVRRVSDRTWGSSSEELGTFGDAVAASQPILHRFLDNLAHLPLALEVPQFSQYGLSGGKDSRLLLVLLEQAGALGLFQRIMTWGEPASAEVQAATRVAAHFPLPHTVAPLVAQDELSFFSSRLANHLFNTEGEISPRALHGDVAPGHSGITGHEIGLREGFAGTEDVSSDATLREFLRARFIPEHVDTLGCLKPWAREEIHRIVAGRAEFAAAQGVRPENFPTWLLATSRVPSWVGKVMNVGMARGLYASPLLFPPIVELAHAAGLRNRKMEFFHFAALYHFAPKILEIPVANQTWHPDLVAMQFGGIGLPGPLVAPQAPNLQWWDRLYLRNDKAWIKRLIDATRTESLMEALDYERVHAYIDSRDRLGARQMLTVYSIIGAGLAMSVGDFTTATRADVDDFINRFDTPRQRPLRKIIGSVDKAGRGEVSGWIYDPSCDGEALKVEVLRRGRVIASARAFQPRPDVQQAGFGSGKCGFRIKVDHTLEPLTVREAVTGQELPLSPSAQR